MVVVFPSLAGEGACFRVVGLISEVEGVPPPQAASYALGAMRARVVTSEEASKEAGTCQWSVDKLLGALVVSYF